MGGVGLLCVPVIVLHQAYLRSEMAPVERQARPWYGWWNNPSLLAGSIALAIGLADRRPPGTRRCSPATAASSSGPCSTRPTRWAGSGPTLLARLNDLAPATLPLALFAVGPVDQGRRWSPSGTTGRRSAGSSGSLWLAVAALAPAIWVGGPQTAMGLFLLVPLNLLAAQAISDLAGRRVSVRWLSWLAPATAVSVAWWLSGDLRGAVDRPDPRATSARGRPWACTWRSTC